MRGVVVLVALVAVWVLIVSTAPSDPPETPATELYAPADLDHASDCWARADAFGRRHCTWFPAPRLVGWQPSEARR